MLRGKVYRIAVLLATAAVGLNPLAASQNRPANEGPVGATSRRFSPHSSFNWRGSTTQALVTRIWYPAERGTTMTEHFIGPPSAPLFRLGAWSDGATPA